MPIPTTAHLGESGQTPSAFGSFLVEPTSPKLAVARGGRDVRCYHFTHRGL